MQNSRSCHIFSRKLLSKYLCARSSVSQVWIAVAVLGCVVIAGCKSELELVPVHGQISYKGEPLEFGSVMLQPEGNGPLARATIEPDGTFVLGTESQDDGVRPGRCRVRVTSFEAQKSGPANYQDREMSLGRSMIPKKYQSFGTSDLTIEVSPGMKLPVVIELE